MAQTMRSSVYRGSRVVHVVLHGRRFPSDEEWGAFMAEVLELTRELEGRAPHCGLVITDGGAPTSKQRAGLRQSLGESHILVAQVTSSRLALGIAAALSWMNPALKSFAPKDWPRALTYLGLPEEEWPRLIEHIQLQRGTVEMLTVDAINLQTLRVAR